MYTPRHLADRILANRSALEGERKHVTILFADIKGSTELIDGLDPEEAQRLLEPAIRAMIEAVHRFEGTVCRVSGDGIMALFGAPLAHEDHAARACYAALTMQDAIRHYGEEARQREGIEVLVRVGLNSGEVVVGSISNDLYMEYSAIGSSAHLAARMEQLAVPGTIRLTVETLRLVEGLVEIRPLGRIPVKGLADPVEAFELLGARSVRTRLQAAATRGLTPFVGRRRELETIYEALEQARGGHGQVVALVGEPGVGKSRIVWELTHSHRLQRTSRDRDGWTLLEASSVSHGKATPWLPVADLLRAYCEIGPSDDARRIREKLTGKVLTLDVQLQSDLPSLLTLLDVPVEDDAWQVLDPAQRRRRALDAMRRLLLRESQVQPLLLVFEDLHWIDTETQALLDVVVDGLAGARVLLLVNYRPEYRHGWGSKTYYSQCRIDPLPQESTSELLDTLLGSHASTEPLRPVLVARTEGNPFFLEECVQSLVETGTLVGEGGDYRLTGPVNDIHVPVTVQAILAARIDRLDPGDKRLLQVAAVVGKDVPAALLQGVADFARDDLQAGLDRLIAAELIYEAALFPEVEYTFKHALTHDVAYGNLLQDRRRELHARIAHALEKAYPGRRDELVDDIARHALRGEQWSMAVDYSRRAGRRAAERSANRAAAEAFEQALQALARLPAERAYLEETVDVLLQLRPMLSRLSDNSGALEHLQEADQVAQRLGDQHRLARVAAQLAFVHMVLGQTVMALHAAQRAVAIAETLQDPPLLVVSWHRLGQVYFQVGDLRQAAALARRAVDLLEGESARERERYDMNIPPKIECRALLAGCLALLGDMSEADAVAAQTTELEATLDKNDSIARTFGYLTPGSVCAVRGQLDRAITSFERARSLDEAAAGLRAQDILPRLALVYALAGRVDDALPLLAESAHRDAQRRYEGTFSALYATYRSQAFLQAGRVDDAIAEASLALELARARSARWYEAEALRCLGDATAQSTPLDGDTAQGHYRAALALADELGLRPLQAQCHLGMGKLFARLDRIDEAQEKLVLAIEMLREMGMSFWLREAEAELAGVVAKLPAVPVK